MSNIDQLHRTHLLLRATTNGIEQFYAVDTAEPEVWVASGATENEVADQVLAGKTVRARLADEMAKWSDLARWSAREQAYVRTTAEQLTITPRTLWEVVARPGTDAVVDKHGRIRATFSRGTLAFLDWQTMPLNGLPDVELHAGIVYELRSADGNETAWAHCLNGAWTKRTTQLHPDGAEATPPPAADVHAPAASDTPHPPDAAESRERRPSGPGFRRR